MLIYIIPALLPLVFAILYELKIIKNGKFLYGALFFLIGLIGGLRFQTGDDWEGYQDYFYNIDLSYNIVDSYFSNIVNTQFEIGYFFFNYLVKFFGGNYPFVFFIASIFCSYSVYRFTRRFDGNKFYILLIYIGFSFILLHFNEIRQSIAISFFLLGCDYYLKHEKKIPALIICLFGLFFQFSAVLYIFILLLIFYFPMGKKYYILAILSLLIIYLISTYLDPFYLISFLLPTSLSFKINIYREYQQLGRGSGQGMYGVYLFICVMYLLYYSRYLKLPQYQFVCRYAIFSLLITIFVIFAFPANYVMFNRAYVLSSIFQGYAASLILNAKKTSLHKLFFILSISASLIFYFRILYISAANYIPYRSIFFH